VIRDLPSNQFSSLVYCYRRLCFKRWVAMRHNGVDYWADDEIPWSCKHYALTDKVWASRTHNPDDPRPMGTKT
jgi:hypothetical protein